MLALPTRSENGSNEVGIEDGKSVEINPATSSPRLVPHMASLSWTFMVRGNCCSIPAGASYLVAPQLDLAINLLWKKASGGESSLHARYGELQAQTRLDRDG